MRAPIYNDRGQFRYSDFVAYIPEYLKSEPDVVTLLQVFSDYINNAYRNIETVEKFEFARTVREGSVDQVKQAMEYLRTMLDIAAARGDYVNLLSVPRANIKSNIVFGQESGYVPYVMNYDTSVIVDRIESVSTIDQGISDFADGDVVFVNYVGLEDGEKQIAYYYDQASNSLIRDPQGTSQDPFTNTDNTSGRIVSFHVSDVSSVKKRYGYTSDNGAQFFELFFNARIFDVASSNSVKELTLPGDIPGIIDYYEMESTPEGKMRAVMRFTEDNPWAWHYGYPTGIIYLSSTSGAQLTTVKNTLPNMAPVNICVDPEYISSLPKYPVIGVPVIEEGIVTAELGSNYPAYANGTVYLVTRRDGKILGEYRVLKDDRESGRMDVRLIPTGSDDALINFVNNSRAINLSENASNAEKILASDLSLVEVPLFYDKGSLDYTQGSPLVKLGKVYQLDLADEDGLNIVPDENLCAYACNVAGNPKIGTLQILRKDDPERTEYDSFVQNGFTLVVPFSSDMGNNISTLYGPGDRIYLDWKDSTKVPYWKGVAVVASIERVFDGYALELQGISSIRPAQLEEPAEVHVVKTGYIDVIDSVVAGGYYIEAAFDESGNVVAMTDLGGNKVVARMFTDGTFDRAVPDGIYSIEILRRSTDRVKGLISSNVDMDSISTTIWSRSRGDMFTRKYVQLEDAFGNKSVADMVTDVTLLTTGKYTKGQYVYDPVTNHVLKCTEDCIVSDINAVASSTLFAEDRIVHYSVPYADKVNAFMPYYGPIAAMEYGSRIDYTVDSEVFLAPLYITKVEEKALKYGWEHREFLNYSDIMNLSGRARNGMVEYHTTERTNPDADIPMVVDNDMDIVNSDLYERCTWSYNHDVVTRGDTSYMIVDIDDPYSVAAERIDETTWKVTVHSSAHGLVDGTLVTVSGLELADLRGKTLDFNVKDTMVDVVDGDTFTYTISGSYDLPGTKCYALVTDESEILYIRDHYALVGAISMLDDGVHITFRNKVHGLGIGDMLYLDGCVYGEDETEYPNGPYKVVDVNDDFSGVTLYTNTAIMPVPKGIAVVRKTISDGDIVMITDNGDSPKKFYEVGQGIWEEVDRNALITPLDIFTQINMFDVSMTNPVIAMGDPIVIKDILYNGNDTAVVHISNPLIHFTEDNKKYIENKTVVYIANVTPSDYNGYHLVTKIHSPTSFEVSMRLFNDYALSGIPTGDRRMLLRECRWYKYTIDELEWDKISSMSTYMGQNHITVTEGDNRILTEQPHGLHVGDYVVFGHNFADFDESTIVNGELVGYGMGVVNTVENDSVLTVEMLYGSYDTGMSISRGVITLPGKDNLATRLGEFRVKLASIGNKPYRFRDGDIVIAAGQMIPGERLSYLVREGVQWTVLKKKRILKVRKATVDEYQNGEFLTAAEDDDIAEYKYTTYSDVDVAQAKRWAYASRMFMLRNPIFNLPSIDKLDTSRNPNAEYSSGEDYANIAPRDDMKASFKGIPDMRYPLIEKIERLAYLRDANVIDFELIGYLARFMGYDITSMSEDVETSNLYRTVKEQERAVREAVVNLPQYYTLDGTNAGLKMLLSAFGVISDVLTLYTNTLNPYQEMLHLDEVESRLRQDSIDGTLSGTWVSTPYIDIELTDDTRFPQFAIQDSDIARIKEQIRVWKPINVVFRDIMLRYIGEIELNSSITGPIVSIQDFGSALTVAEDENDVVTDPEYLDPILSNCAF